MITSREVVALRLNEVAWVVLSACDSGLGKVVPEEGVFGLRRAFFLAGARTVVMSLWKVDDAATTDWMTHLYAARLSQNADTVEAVASAGLETLRSRRDKGLGVHPFYWAPFVASGDWS